MTQRRPALGSDPFDSVIPTTVPSGARTAATSANAANVPVSGRQVVRATFHLPAELLERARDTVWHLSGPPERLTLAGLAERALRAEIERLEAAHNKGRPFDRRGADLRGGRPIGS